MVLLLLYFFLSRIASFSYKAYAYILVHQREEKNIQGTDNKDRKKEQKDRDNT
jgi:hypothetical protein